jgi:hypothetical protein
VLFTYLKVRNWSKNDTRKVKKCKIHTHTVFKKLGYCETSRTLRKPTLPEYQPNFEVPVEQFFAKEVSQNQPPL